MPDTIVAEELSTPVIAWQGCDKHSSSQSFVTFAKGGVGELELCFHCSNKLEATLIGKGWLIYSDRRATINAQPSSSC